MGYEIGQRYCSLCRYRPRESGGAGTCTVPQPLQRLRQESNSPHDCGQFRSGDRRVQPKDVYFDLDQGHLFLRSQVG